LLRLCHKFSQKSWESRNKKALPWYYRFCCFCWQLS